MSQLAWRDSWVRHHARNLLLIATSILLFPFSAWITLLSYGSILLRSSTYRIEPIKKEGRQVRVLVTGVGMTKGLSLCRSFYLGGCYVVGADFYKFGNIPCGRASRAIKSYYSLPNAMQSIERYEKELISIVRKEQIDLCVTCSGVASAREDAKVMEALKRKTGCKILQLNEEAVEMLDDKLNFMKLTDDIGLTGPKWHALHSEQDVPEILRVLLSKTEKGKRTRYIIKCRGMDDDSRGAIPILDLTVPEEAERILLALDFKKGKQWILQEYFPGSEEYCSHAVIVKGVVRAFVACPSASILMHYQPLSPNSPQYKYMLQFTQTYATELHKRFSSPDGHLSFDFRVRPRIGADSKPDNLVPIECNPRCHTATVLLRGREQKLTAAYLEALEENVSSFPALELEPNQTQGYYWMAHDLVVLMLAPPLHMQHPIELLQQQMTCLLHFAYWKDPVFEWWDPLPWLLLNHFYWPLELLYASWSGIKWIALNVSTTKMFTYH